MILLLICLGLDNIFSKIVIDDIDSDWQAMRKILIVPRLLLSGSIKGLQNDCFAALLSSLLPWKWLKEVIESDWHFILDSHTPQCSRNYPNVKLRFHFVEIGWFYRHSEFTWNQFLVKSNSQKMSFLVILEVLNFDISEFELKTDK